MEIKTTVRKSSGRYLKYGLWWQPTVHPVSRELDMIKHGGQWTKQNGELAGEGLLFHYKKFTELVWPEQEQHRWFDLILEQWLTHKYIGVMGPKNSGKSNSAAVIHLTDYYAFPDCTTVLLCSTTKERLEDRIWGEIKSLHKRAQQRVEWLPGAMIEGRQRIITDNRTKISEGRDFRNGMIGVPCKKGNQYVGMGDFIGIKNKRMRLCGDELQLLPRSFIDSLANLSGNQDLKVTGMGNPAQSTDSLGFLCEPNISIGGWDGGIDQQPGTKTWPTRFPEGVTIQLPGSDSPNNDFPDDPVRYPFMIHRKMMEDDARTWGTSDWHYLMFNEARLPRGQGDRRVLTRQMCNKFGAFNLPKWRDTGRTRIAFLDAAYRGVGGDRCVFGELQFGHESESDNGAIAMNALLAQNEKIPSSRQIIHLVDLVVVPISADKDCEPPEDQIVKFVKEQCEQRGISSDNFFYDAGMRTSLVTAFSRIWKQIGNSVDCGGKPSEYKVSSEIDQTCREYYSKFITELWYSVRLIVESGQFRGMTEDACTEFCQREWKTVAGNKIEVESKVEMKEKSGRSPDLADAVAIGCWGARVRGFIIKRAASPDRYKAGPDWRDEVKKKAAKLHRAGSLTYA